MNLKALSIKVLQGNQNGNPKETLSFQGVSQQETVYPNPMYGIAYKDIEAEFSRDPDWPKVKDDPRWLNHLAKTLNAWRARVGH